MPMSFILIQLSLGISISIRVEIAPNNPAYICAFFQQFLPDLVFILSFRKQQFFHKNELM